MRSPVITIHPDPCMAIAKFVGCNQSVCANFSEQSYTSYKKKPNNFPKASEDGLKLASKLTGETPITQNCKSHNMKKTPQHQVARPSAVPSQWLTWCSLPPWQGLVGFSGPVFCWPPPSTHTRLPAFSFPLPDQRPMVQREGNESIKSRNSSEPIQRVPKAKQFCTWDAQTVFQKKTPKFLFWSPESPRQT